ATPYVSVSLFIRRSHPSTTLFPYTTLFRSRPAPAIWRGRGARRGAAGRALAPSFRQRRCLGTVRRAPRGARDGGGRRAAPRAAGDRKSTRLNSSHQIISYAVFCLKQKKTQT